MPDVSSDVICTANTKNRVISVLAARSLSDAIKRNERQSKMSLGGGFGRRPTIAQTRSCDVITTRRKDGAQVATSVFLNVQLQ